MHGLILPNLNNYLNNNIFTVTPTLTRWPTNAYNEIIYCYSSNSKKKSYVSEEVISTSNDEIILYLSSIYMLNIELQSFSHQHLSQI